VFKDFNKDGGTEDVVFEGEGTLNVGADSGLRGSFEAAYVNVKADDGMVDMGEFASKGTFCGASVQNETRRRKTLGQQP